MRCKISINRAGSAFLESSSTDFFCQEQRIWAVTFGLICSGLTVPCAFVVVGREKLAPIAKETTHAELGDRFHSLTSEPVHMFHCDPHPGNMMVGHDSEMQPIDFERSCQCQGKPPIPLFFQYYSSSVASKNHASSRILMTQVRNSGLDAAHKYFSAIYRAGNFLEHAFESSTFRASPATPFRYCGFWRLMQLLYDAASFNRDSFPELAIVDSMSCISCCIRPLSSRESGLSCNIFFAYSSIGSIRITSAVVTSTQQYLWQGEPYLTLETEEDAENFYNFRLKMQSVYGSSDCSGDDECEPEKKVVNRPRSLQTKQNMKASQAHQELDKQFRFLAKVVSQEVWQNCNDSVRRRFPQYQTSAILRSDAPASSRLRNSLNAIVLGLKIVIVSGHISSIEHVQCLNFIANEEVLTIDTETAYPRFPEQGAPISLMQIGTNHSVFLIQVAAVSSEFCKSLAQALNGKILVHWGGKDKSDVSKLLGPFSCQWKDLQIEMSPKRGKLLGLDKCMDGLLHGVYSLTKDWTLSGWDSDPLLQCQIEYAALDVFSCHVIYLRFVDGFDFFQHHGGPFHSFCTRNGSQTLKHGLTFDKQCCCHYERGTVMKGLFINTSESGNVRVIPQGFQNIQWSEDHHSNLISEFHSLLQSQLFCCRVCSDFKWFKSIDFVFPNLLIVTGERWTIGFQRGKSYFSTEVKFPSTIGNEANCREAFFCLSMLGICLNLELGDIDQHMVNSVVCDCRYKFISCSLYYFQRKND